MRAEVKPGRGRALTPRPGMLERGRGGTRGQGVWDPRPGHATHPLPLYDEAREGDGLWGPHSGVSPQEGCPHSPQPHHPCHLLRLCSKDDQLFISSMVGVPCPPPQAGVQAAGGAQDLFHTPAVGGTAPALSRRRVTATILFPFNSACVAPARSSSPSPPPRLVLSWGALLFFPPFPPPPSLHLIAALSRPPSCADPCPGAAN